MAIAAKIDLISTIELIVIIWKRVVVRITQAFLWWPQWPYGNQSLDYCRGSIWSLYSDTTSKVINRHKYLANVHFPVWVTLLECFLTNCNTKLESHMTHRRQLVFILYKYCFFFSLFCQYSARFVLCFRMFFQLLWTITNLQKPKQIQLWKISFENWAGKANSIREGREGGRQKSSKSPCTLLCVFPFPFPHPYYLLHFTNRAG